MIKQQQQRGGDDQFGRHRAALVPCEGSDTASDARWARGRAVGRRAFTGPPPVVEMLLADETTLATMIPTAVSASAARRAVTMTASVE